MKNLSHIEPSFKDKDFKKGRTDVVLTLADQISPIMNELHDVNFSSDYWLMLLSEHIKVCVNRRPYLLEDGYNEPILKFPINSWLPLSKKEIFKHNLLYILRTIKYRTDFKLELQKIYNNQELLLGARANEMQKHIDGVKIKDMFISGIFLKRGNKDKREKLKQLSESISDLFLKKIVLSLPTILVEHYDYINELFEVKDVSKKRFNVEHSNSILLSFLIAKYREMGAKVISYQLGGFMGETIDNPSKIFYRLCDEFHTYGWKVNDKDIPDLPFRLLEYKRSWDASRLIASNQKNQKVLVVFSIINAETKQYYRDFSEAFFQKKSSLLFDNISVRLRPTSLKANKNLEAKALNVPDAIVIDGGDEKMAVSAAKAEILILTSLPATNFLECIFVGQPVMAVNTNENPSELFSKFVPDLERLGVIHNTPLSLLEYFLNIEDYSKWWKKVEEDTVFREFSTLFTGKKFS